MCADLQCRKLLANGEKQPVLQWHHTAEVKCELHACWLESSPDFSFSKCSDIYPASPACGFALTEPSWRARAAVTIQYSLTHGFWHTPSTPCLWSEKKTFLMSDRSKKPLSNAFVLTLAQTPGWALSKCLSGSVVFFSGHRSHFSLHSLLGEPVGKGPSTAFLEREKKSFQRKCFCYSFKW